jgi:hypothetical protein
LPDSQKLNGLPGQDQARLWARQSYYRAMSLVNGGREVEDDLFAGLRERAQPLPSFYGAHQLVPA